jgi:hypothetical protein
VPVVLSFNRIFFCLLAHEKAPLTVDGRLCGILYLDSLILLLG